jgi:hypothetical protein
MDEKTSNSDETLENPINVEPEIPSEDDVSLNPPETIKAEQEEDISLIVSEPVNTKQETENMEVHHHPQLHHEPKPWKEYFLEFLMIFLAVTLGFFAENIREHFIEAKRAKEYAQSLYDDLKIDTAIIQRTYNEKVWILTKFDSVRTILESPDIIKYNEFIYYVERYITFNDVFTSQDVTYQQLRSSGNFRYIKNIALYKNIADYYNLYNRYQSVDGSFGFVGKNDMSELEALIFNPRDLTNLDNNQASSFYDLVRRPEGKLEPLSTDKQSLKLLYIKFANASNRTFGAKLFLGWLKVKATELMNELKKEYHLE